MAIPFNVKLEGAQVVPTATTDAAGLGQFFLNQEQTKLTWGLSHTAVNPTSAQIRKGIRGDTNQATNPVVCDLGTGVTGSQCTCDVKAFGIATDLLVGDLNQATGGLYLLIRTAAKPAGEIRGQIIVPRLP